MKSHMCIHVRLAQRRGISYPVEIRPGLLNDPAPFLLPRLAGRTAVIITDTTVLRLYGRALQRLLLLRGVDVVACEFAPGESSKNLRVVASLQTAILAHGIDRTAVIIALGGGVVGDIAGFVAATLLRGLEYIQIPTTLLAQVDSSVGGKVGVNHRLGKNLIGAFHHPSAVFIDPAVLKTLPDREFRNGLTEMVKIAVALDGRLFADLERNALRLEKSAPVALTPFIARSVGLKSAVVAKDEHEQGLRAVLNLGHTVGHALESAAGYRLSHGEAVALGLAAESAIAAEMGLLKERDLARLLRLLLAFRLDARVPASFSRARFFRALAVDKKSRSGSRAFTLLRGIGTALLGVEVPSRFLSDLVVRWSRR